MRKIDLIVYEVLLWRRFLRSRGESFQALFAEIMSKAYPGDFMPSRPWGRIGDRKNDGYLASRRIMFQVYGPSEMRMPETIRKIDEDFSGALAHWSDHFDTWVFVYNWDEGLPWPVQERILQLRKRHPTKKIEPWGYYQILPHFRRLSQSAMRSILGEMPSRFRYARSPVRSENSRRPRAGRIQGEASYIEETHLIIRESRETGAKAALGKMILACLRYYRQSYEKQFFMAASVLGGIPVEPTNQIRVAFHHIVNAFEALLLDVRQSSPSQAAKVRRALTHVERARLHIALASFYSIEQSTIKLIHLNKKVDSSLNGQIKSRKRVDARRKLRSRLLGVADRFNRLPSPAPKRRNSVSRILRDIADIEQLTLRAQQINVDALELYECYADLSDLQSNEPKTLS
jgi:hypothetical protein